MNILKKLALAVLLGAFSTVNAATLTVTNNHRNDTIVTPKYKGFGAEYNGPAKTIKPGKSATWSSGLDDIVGVGSKITVSDYESFDAAANRSKSVDSSGKIK